MKFKLCSLCVIIIGILSIINVSFAESDRLVDIPVPPNSAGYADFTEEEAVERVKAYEKSKNNAVTADDYVGKSSDYYLKSLKVEGYNLSPKFNRQNDTYTIYVKDDETNTFNVIAEADNANAKINGIGEITLSQEQKSINVIVTAENGNVKVYTINIESKKDIIKNSKISLIIIIMAIVIIVGIIFFIILKKNKKR